MRAHKVRYRTVILVPTTCSTAFSYLEISWNWSSSGVSEINHILAVCLGSCGGFLGIPDRLHLGNIGTVLILGSLIGNKPLATPPDTSYQCTPSGGLNQGRNSEGLG